MLSDGGGKVETAVTTHWCFTRDESLSIDFYRIINMIVINNNNLK